MLVERMIRAARLDPELYHELVRDWYANGQAFLVVLIVLACALIGLGLPALLFLISPVGWRHLFEFVLKFVGDWLFWVFVAQLVGMRYGSRADFEHLLRPVGFAYTPGVLRIFTLVPGLFQPIGTIVLLWTGVAKVLAIREAMQFPTGKAVLITVLTTVIVAVIEALVCYLSGQAVSLGGLLLFPFGR